MMAAEISLNFMVGMVVLISALVVCMALSLSPKGDHLAKLSIGTVLCTLGMYQLGVLVVMAVHFWCYR
jgi:hypothetical protein